MKTLSIIIAFLLIGCGSLVCRHKAMLHYSWAVEQEAPSRLVIYKISGWPFYDAHAQAQIQRDGEWKYISEFMGLLFETETPEIEQNGFVLFLPARSFYRF